MNPPLRWFFAAAFACAPAVVGAADAAPPQPPQPSGAPAKPPAEQNPPAAGAKDSGGASVKLQFPGSGSITASSFDGNIFGGRYSARNAVLDYTRADIRIAAPEMSVVDGAEARRFSTSGNTTFDAENLRLLARDTFVEFPNEKRNGTTPTRASAATPAAPLGTTAKAGTHRFGFPPLFIQGGEVRLHQTPPFVKDASNAAATAKPETVTLTEATMGGVTLYYQEPDFWSISVTASKISLTSETPAGSPTKEQQRLASTYMPDATLHVEDAVVRVAGVPIFYLPSYTQHGLALPPLRPIVRAGQKDNIGTYLRTTTYYTGLGSGFTPGLLLDGYLKAGALVGPALEYNTARSLPSGVAPLGELPMRGSFMGAWIHDNSNRSTDNYNRPIDPQRGFLQWEHKQMLALGSSTATPPRNVLEISASLNYWSDTSVLRDYRPDEFNQNQRPDNFLELVLPVDDAFYLSAFTRFRPNSYENIRQRLPELRFDMPTRPLARTGLYHHLNASFTYLYEHTSPEYDFAQNGIAGGTLESPRLDIYYGLDYPVKFGDWLSFTPIAGVRSTAYFSPLEANGTNQSDPYTRVLPQLGFDLHLLASGRWEYRNETWEINGLRHRLRPLVQYRWVPGASKGADRIPAIDRNSFIPLPSPVDLEQRRDMDDLREQQILRIGLENVIETRHETYGSRNLAWVNFYQDFRDIDRPGEHTRSVFYTQVGLSPAYWLDINFFNRLDTYTLHSREISAQLDIHDGDRWHAWFGAQYTTDVAETNQYYWGLEYRLNTNYSLRGFWRFDSATSRITEQYYGLRQRLGTTWTIEYHFAHRRDARRDNGFSFGAAVHLARF